MRIPSEWPYWAGGVAIAVVNTAVLSVLGKPWGVTGPITQLWERTLETFGASPDMWAYFQKPGTPAWLQQFDLWNEMLWFNLGLVAGGALSSFFADEWRLRTGRRHWTTALLATGGGFLMGFGTRLATGCNAGALLGGISSFSLHGWLFALASFAGVWAGLRLFRSSL